MMSLKFRTLLFSICAAVAAVSIAAAAEKSVVRLDVKGIEASTVQTNELPEGVTNLAATNIIDGDYNTRWASEFSDNNWVVIELKKSSVIKKVNIDWETAGAKAYKVLVSNNNKKWTEVYSTTDSKGGHEEINISKKISGKFVKLELITRSTNWGFSIFEVSIEGY